MSKATIIWQNKSPVYSCWRFTGFGRKTGGYNLQAVYGTGRSAGRSAVEYVAFEHLVNLQTCPDEPHS